MIQFNSLIEKIKKKENIFDLKINQVLFGDTRFSSKEKKDFLETKILNFKKTSDLNGTFFSLLALSEVYSDLKQPNLTLLMELEELSKNDYYLRNFFFKEYIFTLIEEGDIEGAKERAVSYLYFLEKNKLNERIINLISSLDSKIRLDDYFYSFWLKALGRTGELESFNIVYNRCKKKFLKGYVLLPSWYKPLQELWERKRASWWGYKETSFNKLILDLDSQNKSNSFPECYDLLISAHRHFVIFGTDEETYRYLIREIKRKYKNFNLDFRIIKKNEVDKLNDLKVIKEKEEDFKRETKNSVTISKPFKVLNFSTDLDKVFINGEKKLLMFFKKIPFEKIERNIVDWLVCFIQMRAFLILDYLIFNLEKNNRLFILNKKTKLKYEYLVCEIYNLKEDWENLLVRSVNILQSYELLESDYLAIYYLKGEALWKMGRNKEAKKVFQEIRDKNPYFRIVTQRLEDIGKNK